MTTHLLKPGLLTDGMRLRCGILATKAKKRDMLGSEDGIGSIDCAGCLRDLIVEMRLEKLGGGDSPELRWLTGGDTGTSSKTIWSVMTGRTIGGRHRPSVPWDPDDFGRCHRLLELFPAWRSRMHEVAARYPEWAGLVTEWGDLTVLYCEEFPTGQAPRLYAQMQRLTSGSEFGR